jgi:hypothetical protein
VYNLNNSLPPPKKGSVFGSVLGLTKSSSASHSSGTGSAACDASRGKAGRSKYDAVDSSSVVEGVKLVQLYLEGGVFAALNAYLHVSCAHTCTCAESALSSASTDGVLWLKYKCVCTSIAQSCVSSDCTRHAVLSLYWYWSVVLHTTLRQCIHARTLYCYTQVALRPAVTLVSIAVTFSSS